MLLGSRSADKGNAAVKDLESQKLPGSIEMLQVDLTSDDSIKKAAETVESGHGKLDCLVNNAAVSGWWQEGSTLREKMVSCFDTNAAGVAVLVNEFAPLLKKSTDARVINVSSGAGSMTSKLDPSNALHKMSGYEYRASKSALNMVSACQFVELKDDGVKVFTYCPGFTVSNLSTMNTAANGARSVADSVSPLIDVIEGKRDDEAGKFLHNTGQYNW